MESTHQRSPLHGRLSVSAVSSWRQSFDDDLAMWERLGVDQVGLSLRKCEEIGLEAAVQRVREAGLRVSNVVECGWCEPANELTWRPYRERMLAAIEAMRAVGAPVLVLTTGPAGPLEWDDAALALGAALEPVIAAASAASVRVAIENTSPMRLDLSFATTLRDTIDLAAQLDASVCLELNSCWAERDFDATVARAGQRITHVQCSDARTGSLTTPDRLVPGDGDIPLARRIGALARAGYSGAFEIEMVGPRIEAEGYEPAIRRAVGRLDELLAGEPRFEHRRQAPE
ncbi:MAG TPA: TIM barrel protein [Acidimicrobiia bacterium]|nr:TIM barrel protein [Acidimicrobiia bacterium]